MSEIKLYNFFCRSIKWVRCEQVRMTEEQAIKYAKEKDFRFEEVGERNIVKENPQKDEKDDRSLQGWADIILGERK